MEQTNTKNSHIGDETPIMSYLIIFAKHSRMIIFVSIAATILAYLVVFCRPNKYSATALILTPQQNMTLSAQILDSLGGGSISSKTSSGNMGGLAATLLGVKSASELYVGMLASNTICDRIISRFNLMTIYHTRYLEDARKRLIKETVIEAGKKTPTISITTTGNTPEQAANMANAFIEELDHLLRTLSIQEAKSRLEFLEKERFQASNNLIKAEENLRSFSEKNSVLQIDTQTKGVLEYIARLRAEIDSKEVSIQVLRQQATPFNYDIIRLETEVKGLKEKLRNSESQYDNCTSDACLPTNKTPGLALEYLRLYREAKFQEGLYQLYIKLVEIARLDVARDITAIQVIDSPKPPERRSNKRLPVTLIAGMIMFCTMVFLVFGWEMIQARNLSEEEGQNLSILIGYLKPWKDMLVGMKNINYFKKKSHK